MELYQPQHQSNVPNAINVSALYFLLSGQARKYLFSVRGNIIKFLVLEYTYIKQSNTYIKFLTFLFMRVGYNMVILILGMTQIEYLID